MDAQERPTTSDAPASDSGLWSLVYAALWLNVTLLAILMLWPRNGFAGILWYAAWAAGLGLLAWFVTNTRVLLHDLLISLSPREKALTGLAVLIPLFTPVVLRNFHVLLDGVLWTAVYLLLIAVRPLPLRACMLATL